MYTLKQSWGIAVIATALFALGLSASAGMVSIADPDAGSAEIAGALSIAPGVGGENADLDADWAYAPGAPEVRFSGGATGPVETAAPGMIPASGIEGESRLPDGPQSISSKSIAFCFDHPECDVDGHDGEHEDDDFDYHGCTPKVVPEPSTMTLLGIGLSGFILRRFRQRQR